MPFPKTYRTNLWWAVIVAAALALVAGIGALTRPAIVALLLAGGTGAFLVAWEHQWLKGWKRKLCVIPTILLMMVGFFRLVWPPTGTSIVPMTVIYDSADPNQNFIFTAKNNEDEVLYVAEFKLKLYPPSLSTSDFNLYIPSSSLKPIIEGSPASDICGMFLRDTTNVSLFLVQIFRMTPHETREISLTHIKPGTATVFAVSSVFKKEPQSRVGDPLKRSCTLYADENFKNDGEFMVLMNGQIIRIPTKEEMDKSKANSSSH